MNLFKKHKASRIQELNNQIDKLKAANAKLTTELKVLYELRDDATEVEQFRLTNEAVKLGQDAREKYLNIRESYLDNLSRNLRWDAITSTKV